ncbi:MAG TPA: Ig-like domain-containing protein, partial [Chthoniobacteraceae bacterium]
MSCFLLRTFLLFTAFTATISSLFAQSGTIQFSQPSYTWSEANTITAPNGGTYLSPDVVTVTRTGGSTGAVSANFCFWVGETTDNAVENTNYNNNANTRRWVAAGTLTWADGDASPKTVPFFYTAFPGTSNQEVRYSLKPSSLVHGNVTYSGRLVTVLGGATLGTTDTARLEITDAQAPTAGVINLSSRRFYGENGGSAVISVRRDGGTAGSVSVSFATSSTLPALVNTSAQHNIPAGTAGTHYTTTNGTLTWAPGDSSVKTFTIPLPATTYTNGTLHVAINLSSPTNSAVLGTVRSALLTIQNKASTVFDINDDVDGSTFRVSLPPGPGPVRGILYWWPGTNGDDRHFTTDPNFRKIADLWGFAIASPRFNYSPSPLNGGFSYPVLGFLFDRLTQMAKTTGRMEILNAPFVHSGMSAGSQSSASTIRTWPERTIAILGQEGWVSTYSPDGGYVGFDALTKEIPSLAIAGQGDSTQSPNFVFSAQNEYRKGGVTRSAPLICWGRGHTFSNTGAAYNSIGLYWLDQVMAAGRYPATMAPTLDAAPVLGSLPISSGWWAARNCTNTSPYTLSPASSSFLNIGPDATFTGIKDVNNALVDAWLPTESAARAFRGFVSTPTMSFSSPAQFASGFTTNAVSLMISENNLGSGVTKVEFYDGNTKIGEDTTSPYALSWTPSEPGARSLTAIAWKGTTPSYTAFTLYLAFEPVAPSITSGQKDRGVVDMPFAYQIAAGGPPTSYALVSGSLPP